MNERIEMNYGAERGEPVDQCAGLNLLSISESVAARLLKAVPDREESGQSADKKDSKQGNKNEFGNSSKDYLGIDRAEAAALIAAAMEERIKNEITRFEKYLEATPPKSDKALINDIGKALITGDLTLLQRDLAKTTDTKQLEDSAAYLSKAFSLPIQPVSGQGLQFLLVERRPPRFGKATEAPTSHHRINVYSDRVHLEAGNEIRSEKMIGGTMWTGYHQVKQANSATMSELQQAVLYPGLFRNTPTIIDTEFEKHSSNRNQASQEAARRLGEAYLKDAAEDVPITRQSVNERVERFQDRLKSSPPPSSMMLIKDMGKALITGDSVWLQRSLHGVTDQKQLEVIADYLSEAFAMPVRAVPGEGLQFNLGRQVSRPAPNDLPIPGLQPLDASFPRRIMRDITIYQDRILVDDMYFAQHNVADSRTPLMSQSRVKYSDFAAMCELQQAVFNERKRKR